MNLVTQIKGFLGVLPVRTRQSKFEDADYLAMLCHEIGTPLSAIIGLSHVLCNIECSAQKKKESAEMLRDSADMLAALMRNMLDSSKLNSGMIELEQIDFNLDKLMQEAVHIVAAKAKDKGLDLRAHLADGLHLQWIGDPLRIRQILVNLLSNAIKFTTKGYVAVYVNAGINLDGCDQICITVLDTGIGIGINAIEKIFDKYTQADPSVSREYGGTGLGLTISQDLAHLMHGDIAVKSWLGVGSHFTVTLPLQKTPALLVAM
jgi:signal transduction histidine kinase